MRVRALSRVLVRAEGEGEGVDEGKGRVIADGSDLDAADKGWERYGEQHELVERDVAEGAQDVATSAREDVEVVAHAIWQHVRGARQVHDEIVYQEERERRA